MDYTDYLRFFFALVFVVALIGLLALVARRAGFGNPTAFIKASKDRRLQVIESASVDGRRRLVLVRRDNVEHLLLIGQNTETVVETGIQHTENVNKLNDQAKDYKSDNTVNLLNDTNDRAI